MYQIERFVVVCLSQPIRLCFQVSYSGYPVFAPIFLLQLLLGSVLL